MAAIRREYYVQGREDRRRGRGGEGGYDHPAGEERGRDGGRKEAEREWGGNEMV